jgi:hypothetical protein
MAAITQQTLEEGKEDDAALLSPPLFLLPSVQEVE